LQRNKASYTIASAEALDIKQRMLIWANQFSILLFLDNNNYSSVYNGYECLLATGGCSFVNSSAIDPLTHLAQVHNEGKDWIFGHLCYDYKNVIEPKLSSVHSIRTSFPECRFFVPQTVCYINRAQTQLTIESFEEPDQIYAAISRQQNPVTSPLPELKFNKRVDKEAYLNTVQQLRKHIADGDCYEINYCTEAFCEDAVVSPLQVFNALNRLSPAPFAAFYKTGDLYMMCASPERYMRKEGAQLLCQPIKGTARRNANVEADNEIKERLHQDTKERAENIMIVDLVRNDLARCCETGSVKVDELMGIYSFPQVHQMISTISGTIRQGLSFPDALRCSFPMGSMTGAPKYKVMQLIEQYEQSRRELYSGTVGYITPDGNFDFNVVIRSLFYNAAYKYLSYHTGGAITYDSNPEAEWEEMRLKAWAMEKIFCAW
jgi:para-aminobenzoate synthetase component 1